MDRLFIVLLSFCLLALPAKVFAQAAKKSAEAANLVETPNGMLIPQGYPSDHFDGLQYPEVMRGGLVTLSPGVPDDSDGDDSDDGSQDPVQGE